MVSLCGSPASILAGMLPMVSFAVCAGAQSVDSNIIAVAAIICRILYVVFVVDNLLLVWVILLFFLLASAVRNVRISSCRRWR
jgi:hypothetical protein